VKNSEFLRAVYGPLVNEYGWTTSFAASPASASAQWHGSPWTATETQEYLIDKRVDDNNYFCTSTLYAPPGEKRLRQKRYFHRLAVLAIDDLDPSLVYGPISYLIESSHRKYQAGVFLDPDDPDTKDAALIETLMKVLAHKNFVQNDRSGNNLIRYVRLPVGANTKYSQVFPVKVKIYEPGIVYTLNDACASFGIDLDRIKETNFFENKETPRERIKANESEQIDASEFIKAIINPNLKERSYHEPLLRLSSKLIAAGMHPGSVINHIRSLMLASKPDDDSEELERWQQRFGSELVRMVQGATEKFASPRVNETINSTSDLLRDIKTVGEAMASVRWLVRNFIPADSTGMMFGASGTFKSFLALDLALHVAHGFDFMGKATRKGAVAYVASEGGAGIYRRIKAWHEQHGIVDFPPNFYICTVPLQLSDPAEIDMLAAAIKEKTRDADKMELVVIDTLSQTFAGDENSASDISNYLRSINSKVRAAFETTTLIIHHTGHNATERPRGSSALTANLDYLLSVHKPDPQSMTARLNVSKQKDGERLENLYFNLEKVDLGQDEYGETVESLCAEYMEQSGNAAPTTGRRSKYKEIALALILKNGISSTHEIRNSCAENMTGANAVSISRRVATTLRELVKEGKIREKTKGVWVPENGS